MKKNDIYIIKTLAVLFFLPFFACENIEIPGEPASAFEKIFIPAAVNNPNLIVLDYKDSLQSIVYGAYFGSYGKLGKDIEVEFEVLSEKADSFNLGNGTNYQLLPESAYTFTSSSVIPKGKVSTEPLIIGINPHNALEQYKTYLLPITLICLTEGFVINQELNTVYFVIQVDEEPAAVDPEIDWEDPGLDLFSVPLYSRSRWRFIEASSEAPEEGETNGGMGIHAIDNNKLSFWHSKWADGVVPGPHYLVYNMGETLTLHGFSFIGRQSDNNGKPNEVVVSISDNPAGPWQDIDTFNLRNVLSEQRFLLNEFIGGNYLKITINSQYGGVEYTHLAELAAF